ncbi:MAG: site-2 protease family protein, partial [Treponema sp.]|nr:site-2 protease family protein [Treponema sp.]
GLMPGDIIRRMNGIEVANTIDVLSALEGSPARISIDYLRETPAGIVSGTAELLVTQASGAGLGIAWPAITYRTPRLSPPAAIAAGAREAWRTLTVSVHSLSLLFRGINLREAVSGPLRITYMVGSVATSGFEQSVATGIRSLVDFLALISIALGVMNLLPIPVLDGGQIILFLVEIVRRKPTPPKAIAVFQTVGVVLVFGLMAFAFFNDIVFFGGRIGG